MQNTEHDGARPRGLWRTIAPLIRRDRRAVAILVVVSLAGGVAEAGMLYSIVRSASAIATGDSRVDVKIGPLPGMNLTVPNLVEIAGGLILLSLLLALVVGWITARMSSTALTEARKEMFAAFVRADWSIQATEREGVLQEFLTTYVLRLAGGVVTVASGLVNACSFAALMGSALIISPGAAGVCLVAVLFLYVALRPIILKTRSQSRLTREDNLHYATEVAQTVGLVREVRVFDVADEVVGVLGARADASGRSIFRTRILSQLTPEIYRNSAFVLMLVGIATVYSTGGSDVANLGAVVLLLVRSLSYSQGVQTTIQSVSELAPYIEGLDRELALYRENEVTRDGAPLPSFTGLQFSHVGFEYLPDRPVLTDVSFDIERGESIGIIGPSGSGKSTLVQLLLRLRAPQRGDYLVAGRPASEYDMGEFYRHFVFVPQDNRLFHGTVAENIAFFRPGIDRAGVERAARMAHLHDEIMEFDHGYDLVIGSGASDISGGQRQRLGLARALASRPSVLVLDEPTSALDMKSESLIQQTLLELKGELTLFVIAHRMSTLNICDRLLVLNAGQVEAFGIPAELQTTSPFYREATHLSRLPS
jgi:ABC-type multidrug transport system fused ATPase/permease subunit